MLQPHYFRLDGKPVAVVATCTNSPIASAPRSPAISPELDSWRNSPTRCHGTIRTTRRWSCTGTLGWILRQPPRHRLLAAAIRNPRQRRVPKGSPVQFSHDIAGQGPEFFKVACQRHLEGIISKRATSPHKSGRGGDRQKNQCSLRQEFAIGGYRYSTRDADRDLGSLLIGYHDRGKLIYAGSVGTV